MFGSGSGLLEELLPEKKLVLLHNQPDPLFGGIHPEPIEKNLGALIEAVKKNKAMVGLALDGDADRLGVVDENGKYFTPCQVFPLFLEYLITEKKITGKVVQSVSMGFLSQRVAKAHNLEFEEYPVGFKFVAEKLKSGEAAFGGEESGGYSWKGLLPERDGIIAALTFLEMLNASKKSPSQLLTELEKKYGKSVFKRVDFTATKTIDKAAFIEKVQKRIPTKLPGIGKIAQVNPIDGIKVILENGHWVLMRPSGTEPLVRTYAETDSAKGTEALLEQAQKWLRGYL
jgi:phosphomannomutase